MNSENITLNPEEQDEVLNGLKGLSRFLGVSIGTAQRIKRKVPYYQCGKTLRFKKSEVLKAISKNPQPIEL
jgi:hypothetical protein